MRRQRGKQKIFLAAVFGRGVTYTGQDLRQAHTRLVDRGLNEAHFAAVADHLQATLIELQVPADLIAEVMTAVAATRNDVLNR